MENENKIEAAEMFEDTVMNDVDVTSLGKKTVIKKSVIALGVVVAIAGATVLARKYKGKIKEMRTNTQVKKLGKRGYTVVATLNLYDEDEDVEVNPEKE